MGQRAIILSSYRQMRILTRSRKFHVFVVFKRGDDGGNTYMNLQAAGDGIGRVGTGRVDSPKKKDCNDGGEEHCHIGQGEMSIMCTLVALDEYRGFCVSFRYLCRFFRPVWYFRRSCFI